jgi:ubiquitin carboxyl-terminal hydrolase L3
MPRYKHSLTLQKWVPLESDPAIITEYARELGLLPSLAFHDVWSIDDPVVLSYVPRPAHALLLVFPVTEAYEKYRVEEDKGKELYMGEEHEEGEIVWFRQTIGNACGTMGVIHAVLNGEVPNLLSNQCHQSCLIFSAGITPCKASFGGKDNEYS